MVIIALNLSALKQQFHFAHDFVGQKFKQGLAGKFLLEVSHAGAVRCWLSLQSSEGSTGPDVQDGTLTRLAVDVGCWLEARLGLSAGVPPCHHSNMEISG